jgi:hypothetical protein
MEGVPERSTDSDPAVAFWLAALRKSNSGARMTVCGPNGAVQFVWNPADRLRISRRSSAA